MLDYLIYIGRFQPFHIGHKKTIDYALTQAQNVIVCIGSDNLHRSVKNPFTVVERVAMISACYDNRWRDKSIKQDLSSRISFMPIGDYPGNDAAWITEVQRRVSIYLRGSPLKNPKVGILAFNPGETDVVASWFPDWIPITVEGRLGTVNATEIRNQYFRSVPIISEFLPFEVRDWLKEFATSKEFAYLLGEADYLTAYEREWGKGPFVTTDAVVEQSGSVLLVRRRDPPFKGALALPGGFLNPKETLLECVLRELKEETNIADQYGEIPKGKLLGFLRGSKVFDDPDRDPRARVITHAYHFQLPQKPERFTVKGGDDAASAHWVPLAEIRPQDMMGDHWFILQNFLGPLP